MLPSLLMAARSNVGTLSEGPLHASLKRWYAEPGDRIEEPVEGFVVDIVRGDLLIEIQTGSFSSMKRKLTSLLDDHAVRLVHPIAAEKWIVKLDDRGEVLSRRRSPKRGEVVDIFGELVAFPDLIAHRNLTIDVLLVGVEEARRFDAEKAWRRKGWVVEERRLVEVIDRVAVRSPECLASFLPLEAPGEFTTADLAAGLGRPRRLAQQMAYCLRHAGVIEAVAKKGNAVVYHRVEGTGAPRR